MIWLLMLLIGCTNPIINDYDIHYTKFNSSISSICFEKCYDLEIAQTPERITKGLMYRHDLGEREGMMFVFDDPGVYNFWMKNTLIPLDIIWMDQNYTVLHVEHAIPCAEDPCEVYPGVYASYVLEVNNGSGIDVGDVAIT